MKMDIMDETQINNKIKVLNVFQNEDIAENTEKQHFSNKFEFEKGIIRNAIVSSNTNKFPKLNEKEKEKKNCIIFREQCEYCLTNYSISGNLILTKESLLFEPDLRDKNVITNGFGTYQIFIDLYDIYECAHIVVPTKGTYLYNNEETCGFIQVLLKSIYNKISDDTTHKKNCNNINNNNGIDNNNTNNEVSKQKSISYYKYISKSLSFVYNLAHPLVQNTSFKDYKNDKNKKSDSAGSSTDMSKQSEKNENEENTLTKKKKNSFINFDINSKCNIIDHLHDSDLKIYQKINETNYSNVSSSQPIITYKNNLNLVNSNSFYKEDISSNNGKKKSDIYNLREYESLKEGFTQNELLKKDNGEKIVNINKNCHECDEDKEYNIIKSENNECVNYKLKDISLKNDNFNGNDKKNPDKIETEVINSPICQIQNSTSNNIKKNSSDIHNNDLDYKTNIAPNDLLNDNNNLKEDLKNKLRTDIENEINKRSHKKYEEKSFILFRFFNNNKAYETTTKIIKEIDEIRKSENKIEKTITSVPFTSNELLRCIIEQSLKTNESKKEERSTSLNDNRDQKYQVLVPKLEYINGSAKLLSKEMTKQINYYLPPTLSIKIWKLAFCSSIHGVSFKTLYRNVFNKGSVILLIYDMNNVLFGYFLDKLHCDNCYYGSGENFLFTFKNSNDKIRENNNNSTNDISKEIVKDISNYPTQVSSEKTFEKIENIDFSIENNKINRQSNNTENTSSNINLTDNLKNNWKESTKEYSNQDLVNSNSNNYFNTFDTHTIDTSKKIHNYSTYGTNEELCNLISQINTPNYRKNTCTTENYTLYENNNNSDNNNNSTSNNNNNNNSTSNNENNNTSIQVYMWTTKNNYFVYSDEKSIMIGGGDNYALVINEDLCKGQTNRSNTYDNDLLTYDEEFEIQFLQLWIFEDY
ncbi:TLD domain-containing protein [Plasmodium gallinaceum]|uniref:Oxidation resistance protein 1 n=1 Tax=Plasmodium gallinaceum TaxID=5849 RepID=A0A1J1GZM0_PLAGA|nr:TLD domain-containing protein [Plasmodium gallinaceum]CRG96745.1 TLD domain-containing protein [Plasmodium gallinaceum]